MKLFLFIFIFSAQLLADTVKWSSSLPTSSVFKASPDLNDRVKFWVKVYSELSEKQGYLHDLDQPDLIFAKLDLRFIYNNPFLSYQQKKIKVEKYIKAEKLKVAKKWNITDLRYIRFQSGLKERMQKALFLSGRYLPMMEDIFKQKNLPIELTRLVFVESSFNIRAQSKVGASGLWQIMPSVAQEEGYISHYYDKRNHPFYATRLAADILKTNFQSTRSWPLAVTSYNHGLFGVKKMTQLSQSKDIADLIESDRKTRSWGFASENFYSCFLAVLEVERKAKLIFPDQNVKAKPLIMSRVVTKKNLSKKIALQYFDNDYQKFLNYNPHLNITAIRKINAIPAGVPLVLPKKISSRYLKEASL